MKRFIILILFCASIVNADDRLMLARSNPYVLGSVPVTTGICGGSDLVCADFESPTFTTGEIDGQDGWTESTATTNQHMISNAQNHTAGGSQSYKIVGSTSNVGFIYKAFTAQTGLFTVDFWAYWTDAVGSTNNVRFFMADSNSTSRSNVRVTNNDIDAEYSGSYQAVTNEDLISSGVWYHLQLEHSAGTDTYDLYVNGVLKGNDIPFTATATQLNRFYTSSYGTSGDDLYIDDIRIYAGAKE